MQVDHSATGGGNRLALESSPYLRQHADNPVDWHPWGEDAFAEARRRDVPILLSIGYSACHWCHVMAHESFEDGATAALMNELFVNVKVDREERPDVDAIYMEATQAMTGHGGWPMTVFLTPEAKPFFAGTYFPKHGRGGMISFTDLCRRIDELWRTRRDDLEQQAEQLAAAVGRSRSLEPAEGVPGREALDAAYRALRQEHDDEWGGFGRAPKFPQAANHELVLRALLSNGSSVTRAMLETSLDAMASGGIYDHLGGGFSRYAVDGRWLVPHFEKMLYDNALLARLYLHAWLATGEARYRQVVEETIGYVLRDLRHPDGGFYSAEDADSEGEEGRFYVWSEGELRQVLGDAADAAVAWWGVTPEGNFEGANILNRLHARGRLERPPEIEAARQRLFDHRAGRVRPGLDDKVLAEWNGLMLATLAEAAAATGSSAWLDAAVTAAEFLVLRLRRPDGRWLRSWQADATPRILAYASDHAALVDAFTRLAEATGRRRWLDEARGAADSLLDLFWDDEHGGLFTTGHDAERLITRDKDVMDGATPSANSVAAVALLRLGALTGEARYRERAEGILRLLGRVAVEHPTAFGHLLAAVDLVVSGTTEIVVAGDRPDLVRAVQGRYLPNAVLAWGERADGPLWENRDEGRAYVCRGYVCDLPATTVDELVARLA